MPKVSILIPTYRKPALLPVIVESILKQEYKDLEIIISDDASNDETVAIARKLEERYSCVRFYQNEENLGEGMNTNSCIGNLSNAKYFMILHDDCILYDQHFLSAAVSILDTSENVQFVAGHFIFGENTVRNWSSNIVLDGKEFWYNWPKPWCQWLCCLFRRNTAIKIGMVNHGSDDLFILAMALMGKVCLIDKVAIARIDKTASYFSSQFDIGERYLMHFHTFSIARRFAQNRGINKEDAVKWAERQMTIKTSILLEEAYNDCRKGNYLTLEKLIGQIRRTGV